VPGEVLDGTDARGGRGVWPPGLPVRKMITPEPCLSIWRATALAVMNWAFNIL